MWSRWGIVGGAGLLGALLLAVANAAAAPPVLLSAGHVERQPRATWTLPPEGETWEVEVAARAATRADGAFVRANVVDRRQFGNRATSWRSPRPLQRGGTFYVHVSAVDHGCSECPAVEWSNILSFNLPPPRPLVIRSDVSIAGFRVKPDGRLAGAIRALGRPSSRSYLWSGEGCRVRWTRLGARMIFYNLGGDDACSGRHGFFMDALLTGPRWQTSKGLEIGDPRRKLRRLYPRAPLRNGWWWLVVRQSPFGLGGSYAGLAARVENGEVRKFAVSYPAGGD
jgi:hypothetical protein